MRRLFFVIIVGLGGAGILISLGVWQVQRLNWKEDLLARIESQIAGAPIPLADAIEPEFQRYAPVELQGTFSEGHLRMLASRKSIGPVYRIIRPFVAESYGLIMIDTGWIRDSDTVLPAPTEKLTLVGNLDNPNEADRFTPAPDLSENIWFARDVAAMSRSLNTEPVMVVLRETPGDDLGVTAWPVDTAGIPNDHLQYAITWFSLAAIWLGMSVYFLRRQRVSKKG